MKFHPKLFPCDYFHISSFVRPSVYFILFIASIPFHSSFPFHSIPFTHSISSIHSISTIDPIFSPRTHPFYQFLHYIPLLPTISSIYLSLTPFHPIPSLLSTPSIPSLPFNPLSIPFHPSLPSIPSHPSFPSVNPVPHFHPSIPSIHPPSLPSTLPPSLPPSLRPIPFLPSGTSLPPFYSIPSHLFTPSSQKIRFITLRIRCNLTIRLRARSIEVLKARIDLIKTNLCSLFLQNY